MNRFTDLSQFKRGKDVEAWLDRYYESKGYKIRQTTRHEERGLCLGDRQFTYGERTIFIEYKSGIQTFYTGNLFLETISVDDPVQFRQGWIYTCRADYIVYATLLNGCLLVFEPPTLRSRVEELKRLFPERPTSNGQNDGYNTHGLLVPFEWARDHLAVTVVDLSGELELSHA